MDRIDLFRIFTRVVECGSFTRAADTLDMPRSTVSAAILELEARVGARLLYRTTRKVSPTQDGVTFYDRCQSLIPDVEETEGLFRQSAAGPPGKLRADVPSRLGRLVIVPALPAFLDRYPEIEIELGISDRAVDLIEHGVDCALRVGDLNDSGLIARPIGQLRLINVASSDYLKRYGTPKKPGDLDDHFAVKYASPQTGRAENWEWVEGGSVRTYPVRGRITVNNAEAYIASCLAGLGLIQIPAYDVAEHLRSGAMKEVMPKFRAGPMPMTLLYPHRRHLSRRFRVFAEWLETLLKADVLK